ncbi:hypothetical protein [Streptomyces resistomycificus]|uniref:Transposase n=1 Tax=Streptomyces resistomycificus TaxID=67356 RepID=A0A0L8L534_9ACTN|nr:hypothetical protein [Streptomyces resistomycificus]KOG33333.1 hypothetical protein ADK37_23445 [Streptomyces resistomycificus]KUN99543.1 hypothetical protein AQJ84_11385 [Streptomyces resistomycificus]
MTAPPAVDPDPAAAICWLKTRIADLEAELADAQERNFELRTAADFQATEAAGYIDRTGLEKP